MKPLSLRFWLIISGTVFVIDRLAKFWVSIEQHIPHEVTAWFSLECTINRGISWGFLAFQDMVGFWTVSGIIIALMGVIIAWTHRLYRRHEPIGPQLLIIAGGISNIIDRFYAAGVIDYLQIGFGGWYFPCFNIADVAINFGVTLLIIQGFKKS